MSTPAKTTKTTKTAKTIKTTAKSLSKAPTKVASKRPTKVPAKSAAKSVTKSASVGAAASEPSLRFYLSKALRQKTNTVLDALEAQPDHPKHGDAMATLVTELIDAGMDYYFLRALKLADVGFVTEQSARLGMSGAVKVISSVSTKIILRMDKSQLLVVASHIRTLT
ncbi:MAG: hypothetical protein IPO43_15665 [Rhodoferax sp.]|nr:hypothetical protein [Rhodoferax sp.]